MLGIIYVSFGPVKNQNVVTVPVETPLIPKTAKYTTIWNNYLKDHKV